MFKDVSRTQIIRWTAQYLIAGGIVNLCFGTAFAGLGGISGFVAMFLGDIFDDLTIMTTVLGLLSLVLAVALMVTAVGLFRRAPWSRQGVIYSTGLDALISLLFFLTGSGVFQLFFVALSGFFAYFFYSDPEIRVLLSPRSSERTPDTGVS